MNELHHKCIIIFLNDTFTFPDWPDKDHFSWESEPGSFQDLS